MPAATTLPTTITAGSTTGHVAASQTVHGVINNIYLQDFGATRTGAFTVTQAMSGEVVPVNSSSAVVVTVPSLQTGTKVRFLQVGAGEFSLTASGTTFLPGTSSSVGVGSIVELVWLTSTSVLVVNVASVNQLPAGSVLRVIWDDAASAWELDGVAITGRPGGRTDVYLEFVGGMESDRPVWGQQDGDTQLVTQTP